MLGPDDLARLEVELDAGRGLVLVDVAEEVETFRRWLTAGRRITEVRFDAEDIDPVATLRRAAEGVDAVLATGADALNSAELDRWLVAMNTGRDGLRDIDVPIIMFASGRILDALAQRAPDFWSWRGGVYEGAGRAASRSVPAKRERPVKKNPLKEAFRRLIVTDVVPAGIAPAGQRALLRLSLGGGSIALVGSRGVGISTLLRAMASEPGWTAVTLDVDPHERRTREKWVEDIGRAVHGAGTALGTAFGFSPMHGTEALLDILSRADGRPERLAAMAGGLRTAVATVANAAAGTSGRKMLLLVDGGELGADAVPDLVRALAWVDGWLSIVVGLTAGTLDDEREALRGFEVEDVPAWDTNDPALPEILHSRGLGPSELLPEAQAALLFWSGGLPGTLVRLAQEAVLAAVAAARDSVSPADVVEAADRRRRQLRYGLSPEEFSALARLDEGARPEGVETWVRARLERAGALVRHRDGLRMHPLAVGLAT